MSQIQVQPHDYKSRPTNKHAMALLTFFALLPLVYFIPPYVEIYLTTHAVTLTNNKHFWVTFISVAIIVPIISYVVMPLLLTGIQWVKRFFRK